MKYPNLGWAISQRRLAHYEAAARVHMSESRFSRCLSGRAHFSLEEQQKLASFLDYPVAWLFQKVSPPRRVSQSDANTELGLD
jgi:hypothetical protein